MAAKSSNLKSGLKLLKDTRKAVSASRAEMAHHSPRPPADGLVLDVGAGHDPHPRCDVVVDKYVEDDFERNTKISVSKPLVVGDGEALPFADGTFSYVIASHVLEHAIVPTQFAAEMSRVADAGFAQVPSAESELTFGWPFHPWLIDLDGDILQFRPRGDQKAPYPELFHEAFNESELFLLWFTANRSRWHHTVHWENELTVAVDGESKAPATSSYDLEETLSALRTIGARGPEGKVRMQLRCPVDQGELKDGKDKLICAECDRAYPVASGVPVLLAEAAG